MVPTKKDTQNRAAPFGPDMHQIIYRLGLWLRPHWGAYSTPPEFLAGLGGAAARESERGRGEEGKGNGEEKRGREGDGRGRDEWGS